ncbi:hypothetical protein PSE10B_55530 [Pseudomonas amygdali pv. eriobotryae]|nr:nucleotidyltransferase domain-containing protein [Pseudomonas amygdali]GFZ69031.1 hypothetical protein PSE10B_55530 [Pseudomonas amygdali pv. eriobotryae]
MKDFLANGNLDPGIHSYTMKEFEQQFVLDFKNSMSRKPIFSDFCVWFKELIDLVPPRYVWLDGSYLTTKEDPKDIDLVIFYRPEDLQHITQDTADKLKEMINVVSRSYQCDAYFCYDFSKLLPQYRQQFPEQSLIMETYWMGQFGFDRNRDPKGMVQIGNTEILNFGGVSSGLSSRTN